MVATPKPQVDIGDYQYGFRDEEDYVFKSERGLDRERSIEISKMKGEPDWMLEFRLKAYDHYLKRPMPNWGGDLSGIDFDNIFYYIRPSEKQGKTWDEVPEYIKNTFEKLGIPEAERKFLAGVGAQYESEVIYHSLREDLQGAGRHLPGHGCGRARVPGAGQAVFRHGHPGQRQQVRRAELGGLVRRLVHLRAGRRQVEVPLQAYFRINAENMGQFERTLIICAPGSYVHYVEGCTAPTYSTDSLHSAVVEIIVQEGARCRYTTIQNWSKNVYNLVTKRAAAYKNATMEWVDGNLGSKLTMKYPAVWLMEEGARGEILSVAFASDGQHQDAGGKVVHVAPHTSSQIISKSISKGTGRSSYRGLVKVYKGARRREEQRRLRRAAAR